MAAKQGITAQVYQASEDARRAVLSRAPPSVRSHSWLSNLNTTCTIKSAPPRTPEVMSMLSTKCGWLIKRNEQNVWQRRWCCVVPHSFLYYFEADSIEAAAAAAAAAGNEYPLTPIGENGDMNISENGYKSPGNHGGESYRNIQPVGIIDLECYTTVDRSSMDDLILELTGDPITNPDLRSFYFQGESAEDCEQWTKAFLSDRHSALKDEREAYKQICENFPLQLMHCSEMLDEAEGKQAAAEKKAYNVRSAAEESRKKVIEMVRDALERREGEDGINEYYSEDGEPNMSERRLQFAIKLDKLTTGAEAVSMNAGVLESVEILAQYTEILRQERAEFGRDLRDMNERLSDLGHSMISRKEMEEMQTRLERAMKTNQVDRSRMSERITSLEKLLKKERQERADAEKTLEAKNMEFTMLSAASKQKIQELAAHKKILKKEVIELRKKVEDISSDATVYKHKTDGLDIQIKAEQERNKVLERHLQHVTEQIKMQERVMDCMISQSGSVYDDDSRAGDMNSIGGNSSSYRDQANRSRRYPPSISRSVSSRRGNIPGNENELPRFPPSSPRNIPPEITSKSLAIKKVASISSEPNKLLSLKADVQNKHSEMLDSSSPVSSDCIDTSNEDSEDSDYDEDDNDEDDAESRGNVSELTEDRTFRSESIGTFGNGISPSKNRYQSSSKTAKGLIKLKEKETDDHDRSTSQIQSQQRGMPPQVDVVSSPRPRPPAPDHRDQVHRPPLNIEKKAPRNNIRNINQQSQKIIQNIPIVEPNFNHAHNATDSSIAMSSIHSGVSNTSNGTGKLSIAQRARMEADQESQAKIIKPPAHLVESKQIDTVISTVSTASSYDPGSPSGSVWSRLGNKFVDAIDNSVLAVKLDTDDPSDRQAVRHTREEHERKEIRQVKKETIENSSKRNLSLADRQRIQREKQLAFLKQQGYIRSNQNQVETAGSFASMD